MFQMKNPPQESKISENINTSGNNTTRIHNENNNQQHVMSVASDNKSQDKAPSRTIIPMVLQQKTEIQAARNSPSFTHKLKKGEN